jgi:hypothetical protein
MGYNSMKDKDKYKEKSVTKNNNTLIANCLIEKGCSKDILYFYKSYDPKKIGAEDEIA